MRKKLSVSFILLAITAAAWLFTGCGDKGQDDTVSQTEEIDRTEQSSNAENDEERGKPDEESSDKSLETAEEQKPDKADEQSADNESTSKSSDTPAGDMSDPSATEELEVVVESLGDHSILGNKIYAETGIDGKGEIAVVSAGGDNKTLVSVYFDDDASFEYCIIRNGGADVETHEGSFSDIKKGFILDMTGHYQDEIFWANKVEINDVRND